MAVGAFFTKYARFLAAIYSDPTIADAFCDRLLHNAHRIELHGPSRRQEKKKQN
jgi:DNA replication protein DnaC